MDQSIYTVEWMITRAEDVAHLDLDALTFGNNYVSSDELAARRMLTIGRSCEDHKGESIFMDQRIAFDKIDGTRALR